jgi:F-type H+-transporting ATPase subunit a
MIPMRATRKVVGMGRRRALAIPRRLQGANGASPCLLLLAALLIGLGACQALAADSDTQPVVPRRAGGEVAPETAPGHGPPAKAQEPGEHGLPPNSVEIARVFCFPITNSMVVSWIVALGLIVLAQVATRDMKRIPSGLQNLLEWLVEGLQNLLEGIIGAHLVKRTFWFFATVFIFILSANWVGLVPGVGTVGWGHQGVDGFVITHPLFRGVNADLNMTLAMALVFFGCWIVWSLREVGPIGFVKELFAPKGETTGILRLLMAVVFLAAGLIEVVSILFRPVSLSFRLYGNIFAGENMLETMSKLVPGLGWLLPIPFYFLELLVGLVQALVFMLLTAVFTLLMCQHSEEGTPVAHG